VIVVAFTLVYLGEHYVVDLLAGAALAGAAFLLVYRARVGALAGHASGTLGWRLLVGGVSVLVAAEVLGQVTLRASQPQRVERRAQDWRLRAPTTPVEPGGPARRRTLPAPRPDHTRVE
jgi:hypothetical protein